MAKSAYERKVDSLFFVLANKPWTLLFVLAYSVVLLAAGWLVGHYG